MVKNNKVEVLRIENRLEVRLNNPPHNRLELDLIQKITSELEKVKGDNDLKLIVFASDLNGVFSHGMNLQDRHPDRAGEIMAEFSHMLYVLNEQVAITVCEVDGPCMGAALELALYSDMLVASTRSVFGHPLIKAGVFPPIAAALFPYYLGRNRAIELLVTARDINAERAMEMGLINHAWTVDEFRGKAEDFYRSIEQNSSVTLHLTKKAIEKALYEKVPVAIRQAEDIYWNELMHTTDAKEGLKAVLAGREPVWINR